jgi:hypothetical protein
MKLAGSSLAAADGQGPAGECTTAANHLAAPAHPILLPLHCLYLLHHPLVLLLLTRSSQLAAAASGCCHGRLLLL